MIPQFPKWYSLLLFALIGLLLLETGTYVVVKIYAIL